MSDVSVVVVETDGSTTVVDVAGALSVIDVDSIDAVTVIDVGSLGDVGPAGPPGEPGIEVGPTPPADTDVLWADTTSEGSGSYLGQPFIDSASFGLIGDGVANDTTALQAFLDAEPTRAHHLRSGTYRTTATLTIPDAPGYHLYGESRWHTVIELDASNMPILETVGSYQHSYLFENFRLSYKTEQPPANTNAKAINFRGTNAVYSNAWASEFRNLHFSNVHTGFGITSGTGGVWMSVWGCRFSQIEMSKVSGSVVDFGPGAPGPVNIFHNLLCMNVNSAHKATVGIAVNHPGEAIFDGLDIEDWSDTIFYNPSGWVAFRNVHIERHVLRAANAKLFLFTNGSYILENFNIHFAAATGGGHHIVRAEAAQVRVGSGVIDTSLLTGAPTLALLNDTGSATPSQFDISPAGLRHTGAATWYGSYFPWEPTAPCLSTNKGSVVWDPASVAGGATASTTVTIDGARVGDVVAVGFSTVVPAGVVLAGAVTAADTVTVTLVNHTAAPVDLASGTLRARIWKAF